MTTTNTVYELRTFDKRLLAKGSMEFCQKILFSNPNGGCIEKYYSPEELKTDNNIEPMPYQDSYDIYEDDYIEQDVAPAASDNFVFWCGVSIVCAFVMFSLIVGVPAAVGIIVYKWLGS